MADEGTAAQFRAEIEQLQVDESALEAAIATTVAAQAQHQAIVEEVRAKRKIAAAKAKRHRWLRRQQAAQIQIPSELDLAYAEDLQHKVAAMVEQRRADLEAMRRRRLELAQQLATLG